MPGQIFSTSQHTRGTSVWKGRREITSFLPQTASQTSPHQPIPDMTDTVPTLRCSPETHEQGLSHHCTLGALRGERGVQEGQECLLSSQYALQELRWYFRGLPGSISTSTPFFFPAPKAFLHSTSLIKVGVGGRGGERDK